MKVIKRDGTIQEFDINKPIAAFKKPFTEGLKREIPEGLLEKFEVELDKFISKQKEEQIDIEKIQDFIRDFLIKKNQSEAAENFIIYRQKRSEYRENNSKLVKNIKTKLYAKAIENQNANMDEASFGGRLGMAASEVAKDVALKTMSKKSRKNHESNQIYIHDLDSYAIGSHNCLSYPIDQSLNEGFECRQTDVREANSISTALQLVAVDFQCQSLEQFGGVAATHIDWSMVPFVRKSFMKHFKNGLKYIAKWDDKKIDEYILKVSEGIENKDSINPIKRTLSIEKDKWLKYSTFGNRRKFRRTYQYALERTQKEVHQGVEGLFHNLNTLQSRSGAQLPFSSINYGTCTLPEGQMVIDAILDVTIEGLGKRGVTSIFPCGIFQYKKGVNDRPGTPNYYLFRKALYSTAKRIYPNYANCDWSNQKLWKEYDIKCRYEVLNSLSIEEKAILIGKTLINPDYALERFRLKIKGDANIEPIRITVVDEEQPYELFSTMGCRTANGADIWFKNSFEKNLKAWIHDKSLYDDVFSACQKDGRGNICPVTIILPTLAMESKEYVNNKIENPTKEDYINAFLDYLKTKIYEAKDMLIERFNHISSQSASSAKFMYTNKTMAGYVPEEGIQSALRHGTLAIGKLGIAEALQILIGKDHSTEEGMELAVKIETLYRDLCAKFKEEYKLNFGNYETPAENLCHTALKKFRAKYGVIPKVSDKDYFTNSMHIPVYDEMSIFDKIENESKLTGYSSAGCITYVEIPCSAENNVDALEKIITTSMEKDIPYQALNIKLDTCMDCGYSRGDFNGKCPKCGSNNILELRRVTGYLSTTKKNFNLGKQAECDDRVEHSSVKVF